MGTMKAWACAALCVLATVAFGPAGLASASGQPRPHPTPHGSPTSPTPSVTSTPAPLSDVGVWGHPAAVHGFVDIHCERLSLSYTTGINLSMCWEPGCTVVVRDAAAPTVDCYDLAIHPSGPLPVPVLSLAFDASAAYCVGGLGQPKPTRDCTDGLTECLTTLYDFEDVGFHGKVCGAKINRTLPLPSVTPPPPMPVRPRVSISPSVQGVKITQPPPPTDGLGRAKVSDPPEPESLASPLADRSGLPWVPFAVVVGVLAAGGIWLARRAS